MARLVGAGKDKPVAMSAATRAVLLDGLRGAAEYGTASALKSGGVSALAKTGTILMPSGAALGLVVALTPADRPTHGMVVAAPGGAGVDAAAIAADLRSQRTVAPAPAQTLAPVAPVAPLAPPPPMSPVAVEDAGHFTSGDFSPGGLTCDAVSKRFVFGDRAGRKLLVVAEGSDHSIDLTRADVAGFLDVTALEIDTTNGNLWVASAEADGRGATLHRVQLISGRPIASFAVPATLAPVIPTDVVMTSAGVLLLDALQHRVLVLRTGATTLSVFADLGDVVPLSMTASRQDGVAYVTHRDGLLAIDLKTRAVIAVPAAKAAPLDGIERLRRHGGGFVGLHTKAMAIDRERSFIGSMNLDPRSNRVVVPGKAGKRTSNSPSARTRDVV